MRAKTAPATSVAHCGRRRVFGGLADAALRMVPLLGASVDPGAVYEITYDIHGDESGPGIETAELTNRTSLNYRPSVISTASASTEVSVEITDVAAQGI
ncbi:hypothetical protein AB8A21_02050 [Streptomyces sp. BF23-18]|uniref:hypothetical protein n=1 Tax=Streptomyces sp. BF23-18 TaxID=3240282 RepID=UPI0034E4E115